MTAVLTTAHAVLLLSRPVIDGVQQMMLGKKPQGPEDAGAIHVGHQMLHVGQGECLTLGRHTVPHKDTNRSRAYAVRVKILFGAVHRGKGHIAYIGMGKIKERG